MRQVFVVVELRDGANDIDGVEGVWQVDLNQDVPAPLAAGSALDTFHRKVAISELDNYVIETIDPETFEPILEPDDYVQGGERGTVGPIAASLEALMEMRAEADSQREDT